MTIAYWSDIACPYCYIGAANMKRALDSLNFEDPPVLDFRSYELDPQAPVQSEGNMRSRLKKEYHLTPSELEARILSIENAGKAAGLDIQYGEAIPVNTRNAHRLIQMAKEIGGLALGASVAQDLYKAYLTDHLDLSLPSVLTEIGIRNGLEAQAIEEMLAGDKYLDHVLHDEHEAEAMRVTGVPYFVIDEKYAFTGALSSEQMAVILQKILDDAIPGA